MLPSEHFERLLEILLPTRGGVVIMLEGYFDESGALEEAPGIFWWRATFSLPMQRR